MAQIQSERAAMQLRLVENKQHTVATRSGSSHHGRRGRLLRGDGGECVLCGTGGGGEGRGTSGMIRNHALPPFGGGGGGGGVNSGRPRLCRHFDRCDEQRWRFDSTISSYAPCGGKVKGKQSHVERRQRRARTVEVMAERKSRGGHVGGMWKACGKSRGGHVEGMWKASGKRRWSVIESADPYKACDTVYCVCACAHRLKHVLFECRACGDHAPACSSMCAHHHHLLLDQVLHHVRLSGRGTPRRDPRCRCGSPKHFITRGSGSIKKGGDAAVRRVQRWSS